MRNIIRGYLRLELLPPKIRRYINSRLEQFLPYIQEGFINNYVLVGIDVTLGLNAYTYILLPVPAELVNKVINSLLEKTVITLRDLAKLYLHYAEKGRTILPILDIFNNIPLLPSYFRLVDMYNMLERSLLNQSYNLVHELQQKYDIDIYYSGDAALNDLRELVLSYPLMLEVENVGYIPLTAYRPKKIKYRIVSRISFEDYINLLRNKTEIVNDYVRAMEDSIVKPHLEVLHDAAKIGRIIKEQGNNNVKVTVKVHGLHDFELYVENMGRNATLIVDYERKIIHLEFPTLTCFNHTLIYVPRRFKEHDRELKLYAWLSGLGLESVAEALLEAFNDLNMRSSIGLLVDYDPITYLEDDVITVVKLRADRPLRELVGSIVNSCDWLNSIKTRLLEEVRNRHGHTYIEYRVEKGGVLEKLVEKPLESGVEKLFKPDKKD